MKPEDADAALERAFEAKQMHYHACNGNEARITFDDAGTFRAWFLAECAEHERQVRTEVAAEIEEPSMWADPTGRWTADQADAARAMKEHVVRRITRGGA